MTLRRVAAGVAAAVGALLATGCAAPLDAGWRPPAWPATELSLATAPFAVDPLGVAGQNPQRLRNDDLGLAARYTYLPGVGGTVEAFNDAVDGLVRGAIEARSAASGRPWAPAAAAVGAGLGDRGCVAGSTSRPASELLADPATGPAGGAGTSITCDLVTASGAVLGQRLRIVTGDASGIAADTTTTLFVDTSTGEVTPGDGLWVPEAAAVLAADLVELLRREAGALTQAPAGPLAETELAGFRSALASAVPVDGGMVVTVPAGFESPELAALGAVATDAPTTVVVPAAVVAPLLTDAGRAVMAAGGTPYTGPSAVAAGFDRVDCTLVPCVAMTYDDGPSGRTAGILDALRAHRAGATFFVTGAQIGGDPDVVRRAADEGHDVENHTWNHPSLPSLTPDGVAEQLRRTDDAIAAVTGERPTVFRPPYGEFTPAVLEAAGTAAILWDVDSRDWTGRDDDSLVDVIVRQAAPGSIVLQHDTQANTARTADRVLAGLADRGFVLVTLTQLFGGTLPADGVWRRGPR